MCQLGVERDHTPPISTALVLSPIEDSNGDGDDGCDEGEHDADEADLFAVGEEPCMKSLHSLWASYRSVG